jgi:hypothetical protein
MIVGCARIGDENRRPPNRGNLGNRSRARACNHKICIGNRGSDIFNES